MVPKCPLFRGITVDIQTIVSEMNAIPNSPFSHPIWVLEMGEETLEGGFELVPLLSFSLLLLPVAIKAPLLNVFSPISSTGSPEIFLLVPIW